MTQKKSLLKYVMLSMLIMLGFASQAQTPTYDMYITNQSQVDARTYQFDVYVLRTGAVPARQNDGSSGATTGIAPPASRSLRGCASSSAAAAA